jgi:16S rRNA (uracil1498-N3)-methyltransferase
LDQKPDPISVSRALCRSGQNPLVCRIVIRLFVPDALAPGAEVRLGRDQSHYLVSVMRQQVGAPIALFNGVSGEWRAIITATGKREARLRCETRLRPQIASPDLDLIVAAVKRTRLETIVEKAAELGARRIQVVFSRRTNAERVRTDRLAAIAIEATEQTGRMDVPEVLAPKKLGVVLDAWEAGRRLMFCDEGGDAGPVIEALAGAPAGPWAILIGPEGGFAPEERERLRCQSYVTPVGLGPRILRADTAAIAATSLWQAALGDWRA